MNIRKFLTVTALGMGMAAAAHGDVLSQAYEVALNEFRAPAAENGSVAFKPCADCQRMMVRVTAGTRYKINGKGVRFDDFRKAVRQASDRDDQFVTVLHHLESDTVTLIDLLLL